MDEEASGSFSTANTLALPEENKPEAYCSSIFSSGDFIFPFIVTFSSSFTFDFFSKSCHCSKFFELLLAIAAGNKGAKASREGLLITGGCTKPFLKEKL